MPREASARPASNWGFTSTTRSAPGRASGPARTGATAVERDEGEVGRHAGRPGGRPAMLGREGTRTLVRSRHHDPGIGRAAWRRAGRSRRRRRRRAAAPRWRRQSVKPPVDAPASRARGARPRSISNRAQRGLQLLAPRLTKRRAGPRRTTASDGATSLDGLSAGAPPTRTRPATMAAWAASRLSARPRRTSSRSSRRRDPRFSSRTLPAAVEPAAVFLAAVRLAGAFLAADFLAGAFLAAALVVLAFLAGAFFAAALLTWRRPSWPGPSWP